MNKKVIVVVVFMLYSLGFTCFASGPAFGEVEIGGALHAISIERLDRDPPLSVARDTVSASDKDIPRFSLAATFAENQVLKSFLVTVASASIFAASGEIEWIFPSGEQFNMYGKVVSRPNAHGVMEYSLTFLMGLDKFYGYSRLAAGRNILLRIYSKRGTVREFVIPSAYFSLMASSAE
jgi:hypothetical protein